MTDLSGSEDITLGSVAQSLEQQTVLLKLSVVLGANLSEAKVTHKLSGIIKNRLADELKLITLEAVAKVALELGLNVDESPVCKKAMALAEEVLKGFR